MCDARQEKDEREESSTGEEIQIDHLGALQYCIWKLV